jgi:hypothetical protein
MAYLLPPGPTKTGVLIEKFNGMFWQSRRLWFSCSLDRLVWGENDTSCSKDGVNGEAHGFELSSTLAAVSRGMCGTTCADTILNVFSLVYAKLLCCTFTLNVNPDYLMLNMRISFITGEQKWFTFSSIHLLSTTPAIVCITDRAVSSSSSSEVSLRLGFPARCLEIRFASMPIGLVWYGFLYMHIQFISISVTLRRVVCNQKPTRLDASRP